MFGRNGSRNAVSREKKVPVRWQIEERDNGRLTQPAWNVLWQADLGSSCFASPVVSGGLVWVGTNNSKPRDPKAKDDAAVLMCFRARDGKFLWQYVSPRLSPDRNLDWPYLPINCAPLVEGDRLYFVTNRCETVCLDISPLQRDEEPRTVWKLDMHKDLGVIPATHPMALGFSCSIGASYRDRIYVTTGNGRNWEGELLAPHAPSVVCLDKNSGKMLWKDNSPGKNIVGGQWSSPLLIEEKDRAQVVVAQGDGWVRSFDAVSGKLIWSFDTNPKGTEWKKAARGRQNTLMATPVLYEGRIYIANGEGPDVSRGPARLYCIDPSREGDVSPELEDSAGKSKPNSKSAEIWHFGDSVTPRPKKGRRYTFDGTMSTVAIHDGLVIAPELAGFIHCLDARTGREYWMYDTLSAIYGSPLIADGKVYIGAENGDVFVLALSREMKLLAQNDGSIAIHSSPVLANGVLYIASNSRLYAIRKSDDTDRPPGHWVQWRGPDRANVSGETGLLQTWPKEGPPLAWKAQGLGDGVASVAVSGGRVYTLGYRDDHEYVIALEEHTGKKLWDAKIGPAVNENRVMRWLTQRTPTVDEDRLYAVTARGDLICLQSADGKELWRKNYVQDFEGKKGVWGYCDYPLVDGDRLICAPGGAKATLVALNKRTGDVIWRCAIPSDDASGYAATTVSDFGIRHYINFLGGGVVGVAEKDGKLLWRYDKAANRLANIYTPFADGDFVFCASGYGSGIALLKLSRDGDGLQVREQYFSKRSLPPWYSNAIYREGHVYLGTNGWLECVALETGETVWQERGSIGGPSNSVWADGRFYLRYSQGQVLLVEATPRGYAEKGRLQIPGAEEKRGSVAPVIAGGRLYLRDDDLLFCYDVLEGAPTRPVRETPEAPSEAKSRREADALFVPTPQDVVEKMLELAKVKRTDVIFDLGCGDGRIVVTAARKYGCKAVGFEIDAELVKLAKENVAKEDLGRLVTIEKKDLFTADLSGADVITLYLTPRMNARLLPQLEKLRAGSRIVSHEFPIPGVRPDQEVTVKSSEHGVKHTIYLWTTPLKKNEKYQEQLVLFLRDNGGDSA
jgi:outer membrane protein assembly factor BamB